MLHDRNATGQLPIIFDQFPCMDIKFLDFPIEVSGEHMGASLAAMDTINRAIMHHAKIVRQFHSRPVPHLQPTMATPCKKILTAHCQALNGVIERQPIVLDQHSILHTPLFEISFSARRNQDISKTVYPPDVLLVRVSKAKIFFLTFLRPKRQMAKFGSGN